MNEQDSIAIIEQSLQGRYYSCGLGVFIVVSIFVFVLFLLEIIKFAKKIYTHNIPNNQNKYLASKIQQKEVKNSHHRNETEINVDNLFEIRRIMAQPKPLPPIASGLEKIQFSIPYRQETVEQIGKTVRVVRPSLSQQPSQQRIVRIIHNITETIKQKLPILAICLVNTALLASYEFLLTSLCIGVVVFIIVEIMKRNSHENIAWILDLMGHAIVISWFINVFTVPMPL